ncbi:MAG: antibiotic biosynthesis monooxygenase [Acidobacteria bacterium]|nr:antibiotic biosynthesis monooxygenase [Acidobacteriota bacterium]
MKIDVVAHIHAAPEHLNEVREVLTGFVAPTLAEEGCLRYDLFVDVTDSAKFTFLEEWTSQAALDKHGQSAHIAAGRARMAGKLAQPAWVQVLVRA